MDASVMEEVNDAYQFADERRIRRRRSCTRMCMRVK